MNSPEVVDRLCRSCMRLVVSMASKFHSPLGLDELIAAGNVGLVMAARKFDDAQGAKFSTYAAHWIRAMITTAIVRESGVHHSNDERKLFWRIKKAVANGARTPEDIAAACNVPVEIVCTHAEHLLRGVVSLDAPLRFSDGRSETVVERLIIDYSVGLRIEDDEALKKVRRAVSKLPPRLRRVIQRRYLKDEPDLLEDIGRDMGITRERVRQLEVRAIESVRAYLNGDITVMRRDRKNSKYTKAA